MKDDRVYLRHILDAIAKIESYVAVGHDVFMSDSHWQDAVIRQLEIVGEATKNLSRDLRSRQSGIPWRRMAGLRDILIHDYMGVRLAAVWEVTQTELPVLKEQIRNILEGLGTRHNQR
jgi:uncharacterized protein with HEPN domain